jgi:hypothetical protein
VHRGGIWSDNKPRYGPVCDVDDAPPPYTIETPHRQFPSLPRSSSSFPDSYQPTITNYASPKSSNNNYHCSNSSNNNHNSNNNNNNNNSNSNNNNNKNKNNNSNNSNYNSSPNAANNKRRLFSFTSKLGSNFIDEVSNHRRNEIAAQAQKVVKKPKSEIVPNNHPISKYQLPISSMNSGTSLNLTNNSPPPRNYDVDLIGHGYAFKNFFFSFFFKLLGLLIRRIIVTSIL